ncbi:hypothetical protein M405DRAFT_825120 [Rhizopogon salebrosus TDB-379]|nr:hypothetical protein M405DRAFT_825120 [Rhizopogon salebrosus TDB-379]
MNQTISLSLYIRPYYSGTGERQLFNLLRDFPALQEPGIWMECTEDIFLHMPSTLHSLKLSEPPWDITSISLFDLGWSPLTHVKITVCHTPAFTRLLRLAPNFSSLEINLESTHWFTFPRPNALFTLFNILNLPNLGKFELRRLVLEWPRQEFKAFLARLDSPLESLSLGAGVITDGQRAEYIVLNPWLELVVDPSYLQQINYAP